MKADLHIHSNISDGSDTVEEIIAAAKQKSLDAIAVTDHDTLSHISRIPADPGIRVIGGLEISAVHKKSNTKAHVLGYNIERPDLVTALTQSILDARNQNSERQVVILRRQGYWIDVDRLTRADGKYLYKQHIMEWLVITRQVNEMFGDLYQSIFKNGGICAFDIDYIDVFQAIRSIKEAGGKAVLAHPGQQQNYWLIPEMVSCGLDGLELNHPANSLQDNSIIREIAKKHKLFLTGGSDYHGRYGQQPFGIGDFLSEESGIFELCQS